MKETDKSYSNETISTTPKSKHLPIVEYFVYFNNGVLLGEFVYNNLEWVYYPSKIEGCFQGYVLTALGEALAKLNTPLVEVSNRYFIVERNNHACTKCYRKKPDPV